MEQEKKQEVKPDGKGKRGSKEGPDKIYVPFFICQKRHGLTANRLLVYCWVYTYNPIAGKGQSEAFGMPTYTALHKKIAADLGISDDCVFNCCKWLVQNGWLKKTSYIWNGVKMVGYLCMFAKEARVAAKAGQQEMQLEGEKPENAVRVESSAEADVNHGEGYHFGYRFYLDADGNEVTVPKDARPRPSDTAVWDRKTKDWYEPEDLPDVESDF